MNPNPIVLASVSFLFLASCTGPTAMSVKELEFMSRSSMATEGSLQFEMSVKEPRRSAVRYARQSFKVGNRIRSGAEREFIYPTSYEPPQVDVGTESVVPATPTGWKSLNTGVVADLTTQQVGATVMIGGTVTITEFQGFTRMEGAFGRPVFDSKERLVTENRVEMPKFVTYTTPVSVAVQPGGESSFEVSAPKKGTRVTFSVRPTSGGNR